MSANPLSCAVLPGPKYSALQTLAFLLGLCAGQADDEEFIGGQSYPTGWLQDMLPRVATCDQLDCLSEGGRHAGT